MGITIFSNRDGKLVVNHDSSYVTKLGYRVRRAESKAMNTVVAQKCTTVPSPWVKSTSFSLSEHYASEAMVKSIWLPSDDLLWIRSERRWIRRARSLFVARFGILSGGFGILNARVRSMVFTNGLLMALRQMACLRIFRNQLGH